MRCRCLDMSAPRLSCPERDIVLSRVKLWVFAMLAPKRGLRVAAVPPQAANLTGPTRVPMKRPVGTEEQVLLSNQGTWTSHYTTFPSTPFTRYGYLPNGVQDGKRLDTEILTLPAT